MKKRKIVFVFWREKKRSNNKERRLDLGCILWTQTSKRRRESKNEVREWVMGEEREDSQKIKRIAAAAYDYDNDPRWADYWSNILIPPHMAARSDVVDHYKRKFYQRYIVRTLFLFQLFSSWVLLNYFRLLWIFISVFTFWISDVIMFCSWILLPLIYFWLFEVLFLLSLRTVFCFILDMGYGFVQMFLDCSCSIWDLGSQVVKFFIWVLVFCNWKLSFSKFDFDCFKS